MSDTTTGALGELVVIAHRGASAAAPENTIAAFELALAQGSDAIHLDVHLSRDRHPIVIRDFTLERTTNGTGLVHERTVRELKRLDAGSWHDRAFHGQRLQTLQEVLERFRERARFWIELPGGSDVYDGIEDRVVSTLEVYEVLDRSLIQSFDLRVLAAIRSLNREVRVGALIAEPSLEPLLRAADSVNAVCPAVEIVTPDRVRQLRAAGLESYVWTVNDPVMMDQCRAWGVTGIITDQPALLRARIER